MDPHAALELLEYLRTSYPIFLLILFVVAFVANTTIAARKASKHESQYFGPGGRPLPQRTRNVPAYKSQFSRNVKRVFNLLSVAILLTFLADAIIYIIHVMAARSENWWRGQSFVVYVVGSFFVYAVLLMAMLDTSPSPTLAQFVCWSVAIPIELVIVSTSLSIYTSVHHEPIVGDPEGGRVRRSITFWESLEVGSNSVRILILFALVLLYACQSFSLKSHGKASQRTNGATEATGLLDSAGAENGNGNGHGNGTANGHSYGSTNGAPRPETSKPTDPWVRPTTIPSTSWWEYLSGYSLFFPYLWPSKSRRLQLVVTFCFGLLICQRIVNVLVPYQIGVITGALTKDDGEDFQVPWLQICLYVVYRWLQGSQGLLSSLRSSLWIPVSQYSYMELSTAAFEHVHSLSLDFHLGKKTGEVLSALSKGSSINTFLEQVTFQVVPMLVDLVIAVVFFMVAFDVYYALAVGISTFGYLYVTIRMAQWRAEIRRQMVNASRQEDAVKNDSMVSYETVKYFNAEQYEFNRYRGAVGDFQKAEYHVLFSLTLLNTCQNTVFMMGLLVMCFICAYQVATGQRPVGKFVSLLAYMVQLQGPLNFFGTFYRSIQSALINAERLLELFREQPTVVDSPSATPLAMCNGDIKFEDVEFAYDARKPALNGLTFHCQPGTTTALVGESGGGKSTVFRLLFRFYNSENGRIRIDGHDVQDITIDSLRQHIGVVPQDTVLFNETLMYNLKYAKQDASDEEVFEACRAASIHDKILAFPDGYNTKVGERGLRLSGGEKQRVAIARTIIKNPRIILLDEATAALDTDTEEHIQRALSTLSRGRTMLVIAHRLSTITTADRILVLSEGQVAESGTHEELLAMKGRYASMWRKQIRAQKAAAEAQVLQDRAERIRTATTSDDSSSQSDEDRKVVGRRNN
ncbi:ABC transporter, integral membrane type 1 [Penicillium expansum]|uniref:ABC transporter, integral membrane type 1 n=1 Tax=Penicillium expansum TaxID=27334 RepID=A0A0A2JK39_PENEN|nr:ABC transporter, integral membrane type 1 [Penicillium expansum]KAJ5500097.1 ABC transporter integral membrane type 1 [Penicillium expansum]KGO40320.1 ABC transporter, integral membrane type 1 [Penicillium expansum]KGO49639.1 ABC transporter, integral membrane type 1 [Penicillium expansum]KGO55772.1 ABC transporter, integral membrane type 1 [Penicillium expansum]